MITRRRKAADDRNASVSQREYSDPIPIDLIIEILSRLPTKSIAKCRCVSKPWASMLRRPDFTELFLSRSSTRPRLLFACTNDDYRNLFFFSSPQVQNHGENSYLYHSKFSCGDDYYDTEFCGSVAGFTLVCLTRFENPKERYPKERYVICNPSTGESLPLPKVKTRKVNAHRHSFIGYDPVEKQFKVLFMTSGKTSKEHQVLTLGTKMSWRMVKCCIPHCCLGGSEICISINGVMYYEAAVKRSSWETMIVSFDVRHEKFGLINKHENMVISSDIVLVNYEGKLGLLSSGYAHEDSTSFEMWVLEDVEKHEWSKHVYELPSMWKKLVSGQPYYIDGLTSTKEIVLSPPPCSHGRCFYVMYYNIESKTIRKVKIQGMGVKGMRKCKYADTSVNHVENVKLLQMF